MRSEPGKPMRDSSYRRLERFFRRSPPTARSDLGSLLVRSGACRAWREESPLAGGRRALVRVQPSPRRLRPAFRRESARPSGSMRSRGFRSGNSSSAQDEDEARLRARERPSSLRSPVRNACWRTAERERSAARFEASSPSRPRASPALCVWRLRAASARSCAFSSAYLSRIRTVAKIGSPATSRSPVRRRIPDRIVIALSSRWRRLGSADLSNRRMKVFSTLITAGLSGARLAARSRRCSGPRYGPYSGPWRRSRPRPGRCCRSPHLYRARGWPCPCSPDNSPSSLSRAHH